MHILEVLGWISVSVRLRLVKIVRTRKKFSVIDWKENRIPLGVSYTELDNNNTQCIILKFI